MTVAKVLIVDDEDIVLDVIAETLLRKNIEVTAIESGVKALALLKESTFDMVIADMRMGEVSGIDILRKVKEHSPETIVIIVTGFGSIENAVEAMRLGALDYLIKPFSPEAIEAVLEKANEHLISIEESGGSRQRANGLPADDEISLIGESEAIKQIGIDIERIAKSNAAVFIHGESGTGKEVVAHAIHYHSLRSQKPFIAVNCAAVPDTLIESEFFGHEKGAFTGANAQRIGRFEHANGGTLLLDEVSEIPLSLQAKLLRVIQEHEFERVGGNKLIKVDVRLISTSNRDMKEAIAEKILREDLYYRLNVVPIYLPPLRERKEDIIPLAEFFLKKVCKNSQLSKTLSEQSKSKLLNYSWPGNARELGNVIERAVVMDDSKLIAPEQLYLDAESAGGGRSKEEITLPLGTTLEELEKRMIIETLQRQQNNRTKTAETLGISLRTLRNKLNEYKISH